MSQKKKAMTIKKKSQKDFLIPANLGNANPKNFEISFYSSRNGEGQQ